VAVSLSNGEQPNGVLGEKRWSRLTPPRAVGRPFADTRARPMCPQPRNLE